MCSCIGTSPPQQRTSSHDTSASSPSVAPRLISGSVGSIVTALAVTPLEVVKVRQQAGLTQTLPPEVSPCPRGCGTFVFNNGLMECLLPKSAVPYFDKRGQLKQPARFKPPNGRSVLGTFPMLRRIFVQEGFGGIYAGLRPTLYMSVPNTVLYYTAYDEIVGRLRHSSRLQDSSDWWFPLVSGSSARVLATFVTAPLEMLRTRQAAIVGASEPAPGLLQEFRIIVKTEGPSALYKGLTPTLWRDVPFSGIYWLCLEKFKSLWNHYDLKEHTPLRTAFQSFVNGAAAGMIAAFCTTPFDVAKTHTQTIAAESLARPEEVPCHHNGAAVYKPASTSRAMGTPALMREIVRKEGVEGLWRGNQTRMIKVAPACAIMISCYEVGKQLMESERM